MSLSLSTLVVFVFLIPGFLVRYFIFQGSIIKKPIFGENALFSTVAVLVYSASAIVLSLLPVLLLLHLYDHASVLPKGQIREWSLTQLISLQLQRGMNTLGWVHFAGFLIISSLFSVCLGLGIRKLANHFLPIREMIYGPLAQLYRSGKLNVVLVFVVTKIEYQGKRLSYAGIAKEIGLGSAGTIEYLVLEAPSKFFLSLRGKLPRTNFSDAKSIGDKSEKNLLFLNKSDIENINFRDFVFQDLPSG